MGEISSRLQTVTDWQEPFHKGVIYYRENDRVRGVLLWNIWEKVDHARVLITDKDLIKVYGLKGRIS